VDPKLVEMILAEVVPQQSTGVRFQDIAGQDKVNRSQRFFWERNCVCRVLTHPFSWVKPVALLKLIFHNEKYPRPKIKSNPVFCR
jgi:hypothetical protein